MARIYLSATYSDLQEHREKAYRALRQLSHDAVAMEDYVATDQRPLARCLEDVAGCELYVGIFAHRYGYVPDHDNPDGRSITELEYRHAQALGIPRLTFLLDEAAPWPPGWIDAYTGDGHRGARIRALREELGRERLVSFFTTSDELAQQVSVAVSNQLTSYKPLRRPRAATTFRAWTIPPPVRSFIGREEQLTALRAQLASEVTATVVPTTVLTGMGGIGKTQLALAYAQRYRTDYDLGWWVPSETELGLLTALANLGVMLGLPAELSATELATRARDTLGERSGWLLVFDNAPDQAAVAEFLPVSGSGHVLVTSRDSAWQGIAEPIPVKLLPLDEAVRLLLRRSGDPDKQAASQLAEVLGRLPLALEQAAAYAAGQRLPLATYLDLFARRRTELLARGKPLAYGGTVDTTFTLALDQLQTVNPAAVQLAELCSRLAPDEIPISLLLSHPEFLPKPLSDTAENPLQRSEVVAALYQAGLLTREDGDAARMHRLVQHVTAARLSPSDCRQRTIDVTELLAQLFPMKGRERDQWPRCAQLLAHAQAVLTHAQALQLSSPALARLLTGSGNYLRHRGLDLRMARELHEQALAMRRRLYDGDHPEVAHSLRNLGNDLHQLGSYEAARELHEQALAMRQRLYDGDHPDIAHSLRSLANDLHQLGSYEAARDLSEQALAMRQRLYDGDHPEVARSLSNLGTDLWMLGEREAARKLEEQALAMRQRLYDGDHPDIATSLNNLGACLRDLGNYEAARELHEQTLAMRQRLYDGDHPGIAISLWNLAFDLRELGDYEAARELDEQALAMRQRLYDGDHPDIAHSLNNLANDLWHLESYKAARKLHAQALAIYQRLYDGDHPDIAHSLRNLAFDLRELGDYKAARELDEQALAMRQRLYDGDHPDIAHSLSNVASDLLHLEEYERAQELEEQVQAMRQRLAER